MKIIHVHGGDYAALEFEKVFSGRRVSEIIVEIEENIINVNEEIESDECEVNILEFKEVDPQFVEFIKNKFVDYDSSKHQNFYTDSEIIGS